MQLSSSVNLGTGALNFNVLSGSSIDFGLFNLTGSSTNFNLNSNATLISALTTATDAQVLTVTGNTTLGSVRTGGTKTYDPAANYIFNGAGTQIAGAAFTSVANLTIAKSSGGLHCLLVLI